MKLKSVWLWLTSMLLDLKYFYGARPNDCMPRSTFMSRGDSNGWRLIGFVFHYYEKISLGDCAEECLRRTNCKSLNYNVITMYCELNKESYTTMPANIRSDSEFYHSLRSTWETGNLLLGFTLPTCAVNHKVSEKDQATCILAECNDPPKRRFAQYTSTLREVSSVVYYSCLPQYGSLGNVTSTCKPDGSWNTNSFECWRNCTHPPVVNHGTIKPLWALETQILNYVCDTNYEAVGDTRVYCQANGSWTEMNLLCLRICENPPLIPNSSPNASRTLDGRAVSYTCHVDYVGFGNTDVFCQPDGTWSNSTYVCVRECKNPPIVPNSTPSATKVLHGNSTVYSYNMNYVLWPPSTRTEARCESDGRWTFLANFSCKIECNDPPSLTFGTTNQSSALEGSSVIYVCDTGFDSVAVIKSMCNADGNWTTPSGSCLGVCENPPLVPNSSPNASRTLDGRAVSYTCHANFVGIGNNEVSCKPDGTWSESTYVCKRKCTNPPSLTFGTANKSSVLEGMSVTYMCRTGYNSVAAITSTCNADGSWTVPSSSCVRECTNPPSLTFGTANKSSALEGMSVTYMCRTGYNSVAVITSTCKADGSWTVPSSSCVRECTNPPSLTFGTANNSTALEGMSVTYMCRTGYDSVAVITSTCKADGSWTVPSSSCVRECTNPPSLTLGTANNSTALEGMSVTYMCRTGYNSVAAITSTCNADGSWTVPTPSCVRECTNPPSLTLGTANNSTALEGMSVTYMCRTGYNSVAAITSTCNADGSWTVPTPSCVRECTNPPSLTLGTANNSTALEGMSVTYMCRTGYNSVAAITSTCNADGSWTVPTPSCVRECTNPPSLTFGTANKSSALEGMSVTYMCQTGYNSVAAITSTCNADGSWTVPTPSCVRECTNPPSLTLGTANNSTALEGMSVTYMCRTGYNSVAAITSTCNADGSWTVPTPSCVRECTNPPSLTLGTANNSTALEGMSVTYMCRTGYNSVAAITSTCNADGSWTVPTPSCVRECTNPPSLTFGTANKSSALEGMSVTYMCQTGYNSVAAITSTCNADGSWTVPTPSCVRECTNPPSLTLGTANNSTALEGMSVTYMCRTGYNSVAAITSTCNADGSWTVPTPSCVRECTNPPSLTFGTANKSSALEGMSVTYMCQTGYNSVAAITSTCNADGSWTVPTPSCVRECTNPPSLTLGTANNSTALEGMSVTYMCRTGYNSVAAITSTCNADGSWTVPTPSCVRECTNPPSLTLGTANNSTALEGMSVTYMCRTGYNSVAAITSTCNADGSWTVPTPSCVRECTNPPSLTFGTANKSSALEGMSVTYMCQTGYNSVAAITSTCNADGSWTVPTPSCVRECTNPPSLTFGTANDSTALEGMSVTYMCQTGYNSVAAITSTCNADGSWTVPTPSCVRECTNPPLLTNGTANTSSALEGSSVAYVCDNGYVSVADIMSTCTASGNWTPPSSSCLRECTNPPLLTNGTANTSSALEGSSVAYMCDNGYDSVAAIMSTCTASGNWTPPSSSCLRECIDPPSPLQNATTTATSALAGQAIVYMCNDGLSPVNVTEMMCLEDGSWSEANFLCE